MAPCKILVIGGGIAGNALAFLLSRQENIQVTVIERHDELRDSGLQIDLRGFGIELLRRIGLESNFRAHAVDEQGFRVVDKIGRSRAYFPANRSGKGSQSFTSEFEIMRGDFVRLLHDAAKVNKTVEYRFGLRATDLAQHDTHVDVTFSNDHREQFDVVVGADGLGSRTRRMMLGPNASDPVYYLSSVSAYFTAPRPMKQGETYDCTVCLEPGHQFSMVRRHNPDRIQVYLGCPAAMLSQVKKGDIKAEKATIASFYNGAGSMTTSLIRAMQDSEDFYCESPGVVQLPTWSQGRVVLVGDAAYAPTVNTGMGTTSGLVGAYVLAGELIRHCGVENINDDKPARSAVRQALEAYDQKLRPLMDQVQRGVAEDDASGRGLMDMMPSSALGITILHFVLSIASYLRFDILAKYMFREGVLEWTLPEYAEVKSSIP